MPRKPWNDKDLKNKLKELYPKTPNEDLAKFLGITINQLSYRAKTLGLKKTREFRSALKRMDLTENQVEFIVGNYERMTNSQIAKVLGLKLQYLRNKLYEMDMYRMRLEYWSDEQTTFLKANYKTKGDSELAKIFNDKWPKNKTWTIKHIEKKRRYLKLKRTKSEVNSILAPLWLPGGALHNAHNLNASTLLSDRYVANTMSRSGKGGINEEFRDQLLNIPELINVKRQQLLLQRTIKQHGKSK